MQTETEKYKDRKDIRSRISYWRKFVFEQGQTNHKTATKIQTDIEIQRDK